MMNPWEILGVHRKSSAVEIRGAYLDRAAVFHPDIVKGMEVRFVEATKAYEILKDPVKTKKFIAKLVGSKPCAGCRGHGCTAKGKGITAKKYTACDDCGGSGIIFKKEETNVVIELRGTSNTGQRGRGKKR